MTSDGVCADVCDVFMSDIPLFYHCASNSVCWSSSLSCPLCSSTVRSHVKHEIGVSETDGVILAHLLDMIWRILMF